MLRWFRGLFLGGLVGFLGGLLLAPQKGEKTREQVNQRSSDMSERVKKLSESAKETCTSVAEKAKSTFGNNHPGE